MLLAKPQTYMNLSGESVSPSVSLLLFAIQYISSSSLDTLNHKLCPFVCFCTGEEMCSCFIHSRDASPKGEPK